MSALLDQIEALPTTATTDAGVPGAARARSATRSRSQIEQAEQTDAPEELSSAARSARQPAALAAHASSDGSRAC